MNLIQKIISKIKEVLGLGVKEIQKDFGVSKDIVSHLDEIMPRWESIYRGEPQWQDKVKKRLNASKVLCEYISGLNTAELTVSVSDGKTHEELDKVKTDCPAQKFINKLLEENNFKHNFGVLDELKEALGGAAIKPYNSDKAIVLDFVNANNFIPLKWNNRRVTDAIFIDKTVKGDKIYRRLEIHRMEGGEVVIRNQLYVASEYDRGIGTKVPLETLAEYENLAEEAIFTKDTPLFVYIFPAIANNKNIESKLGISRFANATDTLEAADRGFNELQCDRISSRKKIIVPAEWFNHSLNDDGAVEVDYDRETTVYQKVKHYSLEEGKPFAFEPEFNIESYVKDINASLNLLSFQTGLSSGSLVFDESTGTIRTATEVRSENSKTFSTVSKNQEILSTALEDLIRNMLFLAHDDNFGLLAGDYESTNYEVKVTFDDSITPDRETHITEGEKLASGKLISHYTFLTKYLEMTDENAAAEIERIKEENPAVPDIFMGA